MSHLHQRLAGLVDRWRSEDYPSPDFPAIGEILEWSRDPETGALRYLRRPQLRALETYWYLRLLEGTPHVFDLYRKIFQRGSELLGALGLAHSDIQAYVLDHSTPDQGIEALVDRIKTDDQFVRDFRLESLRETLTLDYPSYILALAMGAGKTVLIGAIIATEFALALEYPEGPFVQNALVFVPGLTILNALRELAEVPYDRILPPRLYKSFVASVKLTFTRDGETDIPPIWPSSQTRHTTRMAGRWIRNSRRSARRSTTWPPTRTCSPLSTRRAPRTSAASLSRMWSSGTGCRRELPTAI